MSTGTSKKESISKHFRTYPNTIEAITFSFSFATASIALSIFAYIFYTHANKISLTSAVGTDGVISLIIAWLPIVFLSIAFIILGAVLIHFLAFFIIDSEDFEEIEIKDLLEYRSTKRDVLFIVIAIVLMIFSGLATGYIFVTRTSNYVPLLIQFIFFYVVMIGFTLLFLFAMVANRKVVLARYEEEYDEAPLGNEVFW